MSHQSSLQNRVLEPADRLLNAELQQRVKAVNDGAGRLFRVRSQVKERFHMEPRTNDQILSA